MIKSIKALFGKAKAALVRLRCVTNSVSSSVRRTADSRLAYLAADCRGDLATNTIGGIIVAVVIIGLLVTAINMFFPGFFTSMFDSMQNKLNANW